MSKKTDKKILDWLDSFIKNVGSKKKEKEVDFDSQVWDESILDALDSFTNETRSDEMLLLEKVKEKITDAYTIAYDNDLSPGTYQVLDARNLIIGFAWYDEDNKPVVIINDSTGIQPRRMN